MDFTLRFKADVRKVPNCELQGLPPTLKLRARQATQEPPSHKATASQGNQVSFG